MQSDVLYVNHLEALMTLKKILKNAVVLISRPSAEGFDFAWEG